MPAAKIQPVPAPPVDPQESPSGRLLTSGPSSLSDSELLAALLCPSDSHSSLDPARRLLARLGGVERLPGASLEQLTNRDLSESESVVLLAALELAARLMRGRIEDPGQIIRPGVLARFVHLRFAVPDQEVVGAVFTDREFQVLGACELFRGKRKEVQVEPRPIIREALLRSAPCVILFHTHPGGSPWPSQEDLRFTRRLLKACDFIGIDLVDHVIVAPGCRWASIRRIDPW